MPLRSLYWSSFVGRLILAAAAPRTRSWDAGLAISCAERPSLNAQPLSHSCAIKHRRCFLHLLEPHT